ncbi:2-dehydropantoate 2-reductase [Verticiella sediminum]|uniref:2-dehydropantoate 2-reductase n=1 Tax=Verticiella sediminum TaxID=1247510 RepID=A0A556B273_9BURK|nr:2-dehydropantoate 2-reductase [Verticiella sediminum]TSH99264.1 2-dehydropantoate 2-reductase [Verticiella sediminum]
MKVCIYGAGAIGGLIGGWLAASGAAEVSAVARGATLAALQRDGWRVRGGDGEERRAPVRASADPAELGVQDVVVIAVKGPALAEVSPRLAPLLGPDTIVLPAMNGVPWWFGAGAPALGDAPLESVDPGGLIGRSIDLARVVGCVVHIAAATSAPGLVEHRMGRKLIIGEPAGGMSPRVDALAGVLERAGLEVERSADVRRAIWYKLWGNLTINPIAALTGAPSDRILTDPLVRDFCSAAMREAAEIGARIGCAIDQNPEDRHKVTLRLGSFKASMLQDVEAGRPIELDGIVGVTRELGQRVGVPTPSIDALLGLTRLMGRMRGLYPDADGPAGSIG